MAMGEEEGCKEGRSAWHAGPHPERAGDGWLALGDDDLLMRLQAIDGEHALDAVLIDVVRSNRHFFVRQEAAKRIRDRDLLLAHAGDRHIGQILARRMTRREDVLYLERLIAESRHLEVRKAAEAQLICLMQIHSDA
jgi:hypothetical protein